MASPYPDSGAGEAGCVSFSSHKVLQADTLLTTKAKEKKKRKKINKAGRRVA